MNDIDLADGHPDELLSAELDGELTQEELAVVAEHVATCDRCRLEREALWQVRTSVRRLGPVEPPFGFEQQLLRFGRAAEAESRRRRWSTGRIGMSVVATAAVWMAVLTFGTDLSSTGAVKPPVSDVRSFVGGAVPAPVIGGSRAAAVSAPGNLPATLDGRPVTNSFKTGNGELVTYGDGIDAITVFLQAGDVDWTSLMSVNKGERTPISGLPGKPWQSNDNQTPALVFQDKDAAVMLVGEVDKKELVKAAKDVPTYHAPSEGLGDRAGDAIRTFVDAFGLGT